MSIREEIFSVTIEADWRGEDEGYIVTLWNPAAPTEWTPTGETDREEMIAARFSASNANPLGGSLYQQIADWVGDEAAREAVSTHIDGQIEQSRGGYA